MSPVVNSSGSGNTASSGSVISTLTELQTQNDFLRLLTNIFGSLDNVKDYYDVLERRQEIIEYRRTHPNAAGEPPEIEMTRLIGRIIKITPEGIRTVFNNPYIKLCGNTTDHAGNITGTTFNFVESKEEGEITNSEGRRVLRLIAPQMVIELPVVRSRNTDIISDIIYYDSKRPRVRPVPGGKRSRISKRKTKRHNKKRNTKRFVKK
jgi:hypothetical protein